MDKLSLLASPDFLSGLTQVITALTALIAAVASMIAMARGKANGQKIDAVHIATNSRMDQLVGEVREASIAKGAKQEAERSAAEALSKSAA